MGHRLFPACCFYTAFALLIVVLYGQGVSANVQHVDVHWNKKGGKCRAGRHGLRCSQCPKGYYSTDGTHCQRCTNFKTTRDCEHGCTSPAECTELGCPSGTYKSASGSECEPCPVGYYGPGGYPYPKVCHACPEGFTTAGRGSYSADQCVHIVCPVGTARAPGGLECEPCRAGSYSLGGQDECTHCPQGSTTIDSGASSVESCICKPGYEPFGNDPGACTKCKDGSYKPLAGDTACQKCPWPKITKSSGSKSADDCVCAAGAATGSTCKECPGDTVLLDDGACGCAPGYGGPNCEECKPRFFSNGGKPGDPRPKCTPCGLHFTSPAGAMSAEYCECDAGYGADPTDKEQRRCVTCGLGTFNPGPVSSSVRGSAAAVAAQRLKRRRAPADAMHVPRARPCQRCGAAYPLGNFTTLQTGSAAATDCMCRPGFGGSGCAACSEGTYSEGGRSAACQSCPAGGAGYTTIPERAAASIAACVCLPGHGASELGVCRLCPPNTYSEGGTKQECRPCPFGSTSPAGASALEDCVSVAQECPLGQTAPAEAVSQEQCACYPGFGGSGSHGAPCTICPVGTYAPGGDLEVCKPCRFGFTSPVGSTTAGDCFPSNQCPAGTELTGRGASHQQCRCKAGYGSTTGEGTCRLCPAGTFSVGGTMEDCKPCPFGATSKPGAAQPDECVLTSQACPVGQMPVDNAVSKQQCSCLPGYGGGRTPSDACSICPAGTYAGGGNTQPCTPCKFGYTSPTGATSEEQCYPTNACPAGTEAPPGLAISSVQECVCKAGFGSYNDSNSCSLCSAGTFSPGGSKDECRPCPFGYTSAVGSFSRKDCVATPQACPIGQRAPDSSVAKDQCVCYPGYGGGSSPDDPCTMCPAGTYSPGHTLDKCLPCGFGWTSPMGSNSLHDCYPVKDCPAGTRFFDSQQREGQPSSTQECKCKPGYGSSTGQGACKMCPVGTFSPGGSMEDCKPCPFGTTSGAGATDTKECEAVPQACPPGQVAPPGAVSPEQCACMPGYGGGATPKDACHICPAGAWSPGNGTNPCIPCGFGYNSPEGSMSEDACFTTNACPPGTDFHKNIATPSSVVDCVCKPGYGSLTGSGICRMCPAGTFSEGGTMEDCKPCPFGTSSGEGADRLPKCQPIPQACPIGQWAPKDAVSVQDCRCYKGFGGGDRPSDPCTICPAGMFSANSGTAKCIPCRFGFTSPEGAGSEEECYPVDACPAGTEILTGAAGASPAECKCKPGYGNIKGTAGPCRMCPVGTFSEGGTQEDCKPCPFGYTSRAGAESSRECVPVRQKCPPGQVAPPDAVSSQQCACLPGFGGGKTREDTCTICPAGSWSPGGTTNPCLPCGFGFSSPEGSQSTDQCVPVNACPAGTEYKQQDVDKTFTTQDCVCKPGFGSASGLGICRLCAAGTFGRGGNMEDCLPCGFGHTSRAGAESSSECVPVRQKCPPGQVAPPDAVSSEQCACLPGFGGGKTRQDACTICPAGSWSPGGTTGPCLPCGFGFSSPEGSESKEQCVAVNACPAGTEYKQKDVDKAFTTQDCVCKPGFGSASGLGICRLCPAGTFGRGGNMEDCLPCGFGFTSKEGATSMSDCQPVAQSCPIGQWAPDGAWTKEMAVSQKQCRCYSGFGGGNSPLDPCTFCPAGSYSANRGTDKCIPCPAGHTSPEGSDSIEQCHPTDACPAGTEAEPGQTLLQPARCNCKPGYGSSTGSAPCHLCPAGTFSQGQTMEACLPCRFGTTSQAGAQHVDDCVPVAQTCPVGQIAPPHAVSEEECGCLPGFGGGEHPKAACAVCQPGSWAPGGDTQPCMPCDFGYTSPRGAWSEKQCVPANACPAGTQHVGGNDMAFSMADCVCKPGHGNYGMEVCRTCPRGTFSPGGTLEECVPCAPGMTSGEGATSARACFPQVAGRNPPDNIYVPEQQAALMRTGTAQQQLVEPAALPPAAGNMELVVMPDKNISAPPAVQKGNLSVAAQKKIHGDEVQPLREAIPPLKVPQHQRQPGPEAQQQQVALSGQHRQTSSAQAGVLTDTLPVQLSAAEYRGKQHPVAAADYRSKQRPGASAQFGQQPPHAGAGYRGQQPPQATADVSDASSQHQPMVAAHSTDPAFEGGEEDLQQADAVTQEPLPATMLFDDPANGQQHGDARQQQSADDASSLQGPLADMQEKFAPQGNQVAQLDAAEYQAQQPPGVAAEANAARSQQQSPHAAAAGAVLEEEEGANQQQGAAYDAEPLAGAALLEEFATDEQHHQQQQVNPDLDKLVHQQLHPSSQDDQANSMSAAEVPADTVSGQLLADDPIAPHTAADADTASSRQQQADAANTPSPSTASSTDEGPQEPQQDSGEPASDAEVSSNELVQDVPASDYTASVDQDVIAGATAMLATRNHGALLEPTDGAEADQPQQQEATDIQGTDVVPGAMMLPADASLEGQVWGTNADQLETTDGLPAAVALQPGHPTAGNDAQGTNSAHNKAETLQQQAGPIVSGADTLTAKSSQSHQVQQGVADALVADTSGGTVLVVGGSTQRQPATAPIQQQQQQQQLAVEQPPAQDIQAASRGYKPVIMLARPRLSERGHA